MQVCFLVLLEAKKEECGRYRQDRKVSPVCIIIESRLVQAIR